MAAKFHISDNGMPGKCSAASPDSCPKTQAGDSFHGTLEEATQESQQRFEKQLGAFVTASKNDEEKASAGEAFAGRFATAAQKVIDSPDDAKAQSELQAIRDEMTEEMKAGRGSAITDSKIYEDAEVALAEAQAAKSKGYTAARFENYTAAELRRELEMWDTENPADDPTDLEMALIAAEEREASQEELYVHRQGKIVRVNKDGSVEAFTADGKKASTSATAEKLREGYGGWKRAQSGSATNLPDAPKPQITLEQEDELVDEYDGYKHTVKVVEARLKDVHARHRAYNSANAAAEGRAYYIGPTPKGYGNIPGVNPNGATYFTASEEQKAELKDAQDTVAKVRDAEVKAQTALEENGLGHRIPDEGHTIRVRTQAQKWLLEDELKGQISDGQWENTSGNPWEDWTSAKVIVDPKNPGRNFNTAKDNYQLNKKELLDVVGGRMIENVQSKTNAPDYNEKAMQADLKDLRTIFKTKRGPVSGD